METKRFDTVMPCGGRCKVLIAGNSCVFYGNADMRSSAEELIQQGRQNNRGCFIGFSVRTVMRRR